ncbi:MAG: sigma-70 family RNA polymerase sigma factor [Fimbriimonadaceae bacterium]|nr:sigma-70 family RNA polymerase sigma factor [Fimbriimonadaceae bacterium]
MLSIVHSIGWIRERSERRADRVVAFLDAERPWIFRLALAIVHRTDLAEDVTQETLLACWKARHSVRETAAIRGWVRRTLVRQALRQRVSHLAMDGELAARGDLAESAAVRAVLASMPASMRAVLALADYERLSYAEIAAALEIPEGTVGSRLHAARAMFRARWEGQ